MKIHRLTVDGKDYFLPDPIDELRAQILSAVQGGGGYVNIPPLRGGPGIDILFSPGMPVTWTQLDIGESGEPGAPGSGSGQDSDDESFEDPYSSL